MRDLAGLLVSIHRLGGLTKFIEMADWIAELSGKLIEEALVGMAKGDFALVDELTQAESFVSTMVTELVCQEICLRSYSRLVAALQGLTGRYLGNLMTVSDTKRMELLRQLLFKAKYYSLLPPERLHAITDLLIVDSAVV